MNNLDQLTKLTCDFQSAFERANWQKIAELNEQMRPVVEAAVAHSGAKAIQTQLETLFSLYQEVQVACCEERDQIQKKITDIAQSKPGIQAYSANSAL